jgi:membrane protein DedA with SNARE-associated domain
MIEALPSGIREAIAFISGHGGLWVYLIVFTAAVLENIFPPYPGDTILFAGAALAATGAVLWPLVLLVGISGNVLGAMAVYTFGFTRGRKYFLSHQGKFVEPERLHRIELWFSQYGARVIIISRFLTGIRSAVSLAAGLGEVSWRKMIIYTTISTLLWNGLIVGLAISLGRNWDAVYEFAMLYNRLVIALLAAIALAWAARQLWVKRRGKTVDSL